MQENLYRASKRVIYSLDGLNFSDVSDNVIEFEVVLRELKAGLSSFRIKLQDTDNNLSLALPFPKKV
ncbi:MAG: hypothetical protein QXX95_00785 [Nitrososphaerales archaeon]